MINYSQKTFKDKYIGTIYEYDIVSAGLHVLRDLGHISESKYKMIKKMTKDKRNVYIGKLLKGEELGGVIEDKLKEVINAFVHWNEIDEYEIVSVKKDAIFTTKPATYLIFDHVYEFRCKNTYTSFMKVFNTELYYNSFDMFLDIKGVHHDTKFQEIISMIMLSMENGDYRKIKRIFNRFYNRRYEPEFTQEFLTGKYNYDSFTAENITGANYPSIESNFKVLKEINKTIL